MSGGDPQVSGGEGRSFLLQIRDFKENGTVVGGRPTVRLVRSFLESEVGTGV